MCVSITLWASRVNDSVIYVPVSRCWPRVIDEDRQVSAVDKHRTRVSQLIADRPLSARSVLASALLGADQPHLTVGELVAMASLFGISEGAATPIFLLNPGHETMIERGTTKVRCTIPELPLPAGRYYVWGGVYRNWTNGEELIGWQPLTHFDVHGPELDAAPRAVVRLAPIHVESAWEIEAA